MEMSESIGQMRDPEAGTGGIAPAAEGAPSGMWASIRE